MWKPTKKQHLTNKKYVDENGGSGSGLDMFVVNFDADAAANALTCDKTYDEIRSANAAGKVVIGLLKNPETDLIMVYEYAGQPLESSYVKFINNHINANGSGGGSIMVLSLFVHSDGTVSDDVKQITIG